MCTSSVLLLKQAQACDGHDETGVEGEEDAAGSGDVSVVRLLCSIDAKENPDVDEAVHWISLRI